ncbi:MAG: hypothetical protein RMI51_05680, partial [Aquificaceae bacterium]|nr:hypothetical protein [Aquificaceae bacterium]
RRGGYNPSQRGWLEEVKELYAQSHVLNSDRVALMKFSKIVFYTKPRRLGGEGQDNHKHSLA